MLAGLKKMNDGAEQQSVSSADLFVAAHLISLLEGFLAGVTAGLALGPDNPLAINANRKGVLFGTAAVGYAGIDFLRGIRAFYYTRNFIRGLASVLRSRLVAS